MDQSYSVQSKEVQQSRASLLDHCASSPPAVPAVLEATIAIVDNNPIIDYGRVKKQLVCMYFLSPAWRPAVRNEFDSTDNFLNIMQNELFTPKDVENTKFFVVSFAPKRHDISANIPTVNRALQQMFLEVEDERRRKCENVNRNKRNPDYDSTSCGMERQQHDSLMQVPYAYRRNSNSGKRLSRNKRTGNFQ